MSPQGVYPVADVCAIGDEISSTYEGRHITLYADNLQHGNLTVVTKGYPVWWGDTGVGVAFATQVLGENPLIAVDTEGIWCQDVYAFDAIQNSDVAPGDQLFINDTTGVISKNNDMAVGRPFGYALGTITGGNEESIAVKVHWDPSLDPAKREFYTAGDGAYAYGKHYTAIFAGGQNTGLEYHDQRVTGAQDGGIYGWATWMELAAAFVPDGNLIVAHEIGIYDVGCGLNVAGRVVMQQMQAQLAAVPNTSFHWFRLNLAAAGGTATAVIAAANPESIGFVIDVAINAANKIGNVPLFDIVGHGIGFVEVFSV